MLGYVARRLLEIIPTMLGVILFLFFLFSFIAPDPAQLLAGKIANAERIGAIRAQLGLDEPYWKQLLIFVKQVVTFDFGDSWSTYEKVSDLLAARLPPSLLVGLTLTVLNALIAIGIAMLVAYTRGRLTDRAIMVSCTVAQSISILVYIIVFQFVFAFWLGWFPVQGWGATVWENLAKYAVLPVIIAIAVSLAPDIRLYRTFLLDELGQDYVRTARSKGLGEHRVLWVHVLRNASIPIVTNLMVQLPLLLIGLFLIERFFSIPGIGREVIIAAERSDFPMIKAITVYVALATLLANLAADLIYQWVDPRVKLQ
jgi:peptide/nickel transport system permease protein